MQRAMKDVEVKEAYASQLLNASSDMIYTADKKIRLVTWNKAFTDNAQTAGNCFEKGTAAFEWDSALQIHPRHVPTLHDLITFIGYLGFNNFSSRDETNLHRLKKLIAMREDRCSPL